MRKTKPDYLPPAVESEIPDDIEAAAEYFDTHSVASLFEDDLQPVGVLEIAQRAGVHEVTVRQWKARYPSFPRPLWTVSGQPAWDWADVQEWLKVTPRRPGRPRKLAAPDV